MRTEDINKHAGNISHLLYEKGALTIHKIGEFTHYKELHIHLSLGWLLKEQKVRFFEKDGSMYVELDQPASEIYF